MSESKLSGKRELGVRIEFITELDVSLVEEWVGANGLPGEEWTVIDTETGRILYNDECKEETTETSMDYWVSFLRHNGHAEAADLLTRELRLNQEAENAESN